MPDIPYVPSSPNAGSRRTARITTWANSTYFAEGFPYMLVRYMLGVFFTDLGVREAYLGFLNFLGLPWNLKFLWAPLVDYFGTKRRWIVTIELLLAIGIGLVALLAFNTGTTPLWSGISVAATLQLCVFVFVALAFVSATHDIAIDAYYLTALHPVDQARYNGDRVLAYRLAVIYVKSLLVAAAASIGWGWSWTLAAITLGLLCGAHAYWLPRPEVAVVRPAVPNIGHILRHFGTAWRAYLDQPRVALMLLFIIAYKLGDEIMFSMNTPFLLRELAITKDQLAWVSGILGTIGTVVGAIFGSWWIAKVGLRKAIWPLTLLMNLNIWAYVALAIWKPDPATMQGIAWIAAVHTYESWAAGLGNAVLLIYLMRTCKPDFKAAHYAVGSALMSLGSTLIGGFGGVLVETVGYVWLYVIGFVATIPSMALIPYIPHLAPRSQSE